MFEQFLCVLGHSLLPAEAEMMELLPSEVWFHALTVVQLAMTLPLSNLGPMTFVGLQDPT